MAKSFDELMDAIKDSVVANLEDGIVGRAGRAPALLNVGDVFDIDGVEHRITEVKQRWEGDTLKMDYKAVPVRPHKMIMLTARIGGSTSFHWPWVSGQRTERWCGYRESSCGA